MTAVFNALHLQAATLDVIAATHAPASLLLQRQQQRLARLLDAARSGSALYRERIDPAVARAAHLGRMPSFLDEIKAGLPNEPLSGKMRALLAIAKHVQEGGLKVTADDIAAARKEGATDLEIHDTVLIAAAFCMFNRYVDGLGTWRPDPNEAYVETGRMLAFNGYLNSIPA